MRRIKKRFIQYSAVFVVFLLLLTPTAIVFAENSAAGQPTVTGKNWMAYLPDTTALSEINLPGTHASGAAAIQAVKSDAILSSVENALYAASSIPAASVILVPTLPTLSIDIPIELSKGIGADAFAKTQALFIDEQLEAGSRVLDVRLAVNHSVNGSETASDLILSYMGFKCMDKDETELTFRKVIEYAKAFVTQNPTETVIIEAGGIGNPRDFEAKVLQETPGFLKTLGCNDLLRNIFIASDIDEQSGERASRVLLKVKEELKSDPQFIIDGDIPTVGEARGKVIIADWETDRDYQDFSCSGIEKWNGRCRNIGNDPKDEKNGIKYYLDSSTALNGTEKRRGTDRAVTACTNEDGDGIKNAVFKLLSNINGTSGNVFGTVIKSRGEEIRNGESMAEFTANTVNSKLKSYAWQQGKYYGIISMDFMDSEMAKKIYETNSFDYDAAGSVFSDGALGIIIGVAVFAAASAAVIVAVKNKKKPAAAAEKSTEEDE